MGEKVAGHYVTEDGPFEDAYAASATYIEIDENDRNKVGGNTMDNIVPTKKSCYSK